MQFNPHPSMTNTLVATHGKFTFLIYGGGRGYFTHGYPTHGGYFTSYQDKASKLPSIPQGPFPDVATAIINCNRKLGLLLRNNA